jgi:DNA repair protein RecN (Recombination protein N)
MLQHLHIRNLALLEEVSLEPEAGLVAITGETGAGKSVILGALDMLSGSRVDKTVIRQGQETCSVEAGIWLDDALAVDSFLEGLGLPACEDGQLLLSRTLSRKKMAKIHINGALTTLQNLKALCEYWIDFHGPSEPRKLFRERYQLEMLDEYGGLGGRLLEYQVAYGEWKEALARIRELASQEALSPDQEAFYRSQLEEIDALDASEDSIGKLETDYARFSRVKELSQNAQQVVGRLSSGQGGVQSGLSDCLRYARALGAVDTEAVPLLERLEGLAIDAQDLAAEFQSYCYGLDVEPGLITQTEDRMTRWQSVKRRFGGTLESVLAYREELSGKLNSREDVEAMLRELEQQASAMEKELGNLARVLTKGRLEAALDLSGLVSAKLKNLGFKKASLEIRVVPEQGLKEYGDSSCQFLFSANPGSEKLPLNRIASSGETARVLLALKTILAKIDSTPVLVFDEVDANIGGEVGMAVGAELASISQNHQIFCVTHLPQVAAQGNQHILVQKHQTEDSTWVEIAPLPGKGKGRVDELARMLGDRNSKTAQKHAKELLAAKH